MKHFKGAGLFLMAVVVVALTPVSGCTRVKVVPPAPLLYAPAPLTTSVAQVYSDYSADAAAAASRYEGKQLWLNQVVIGSYSPSPEKYITIDMAQMAGQLIGTFHNFLGDITVDYLLITAYSPQKFQSGDIVEIVGTCQGLHDQTVTIGIDYINALGAGGVVTPAQGSSY
jgi:hypothetical protein